MAETDSDSPSPDKKLSAAAIARDWGCSRAYVGQCVKKGCPLTSLEEARAWRTANARYGVGYRSKSTPPPAPPPPPIAAAQPDPPRLLTRDFTTVDQSLAAAVEIEAEAHRLVSEAQSERNDALISVRIQSYNKARDGRMDAQRMVMEYREKEGQLISLDACRELIRRAWATHLNRLRSLPKRTALKVAPADDVRAEKLLVEEIEAVIAETRKEFEA